MRFLVNDYTYNGSFGFFPRGREDKSALVFLIDTFAKGCKAPGSFANKLAQGGCIHGCWGDTGGAPETKPIAAQGRRGRLLTTPSSQSTIVGEIMDISVDGVSFQYISGEEPDQEAYKLSLVSADHSFYLNSLPINTISDMEMAKIPFGSVSTRRRGE